MPNKEIALHPNSIYHIYNHVNGNESLFKNDNNFLFFLNKYDYYVEPIAKTFAYCLMPNHLHLMVQIKDESELQQANQFFKLNKNPLLKNIETLSSEKLSLFISKTFGNLFSSYTQAFNKQQNRKGNLFMSNIKRKHIDNVGYYSNLIFYIHNNPVHHGFVSKIDEWKYSSYHTFLQDKKTKIQKQEVIDWFGSRKEFLHFHQKSKMDLMFDL